MKRDAKVKLRPVFHISSASCMHSNVIKSDITGTEDIAGSRPEYTGRYYFRNSIDDGRRRESKRFIHNYFHADATLRMGMTFAFRDVLLQLSRAN